MLIKSIKEKKNLKVASYRIDEEIVNKFKALCKKHKIKQVVVIENAMRQAIKEMEDIDR